MFPLNYSSVYSKPLNHQPPEDAKDLIRNTQYPNLNSRDYGMRAINHTIHMKKAWECISLNAEGHVVIGTNKLNGREWYATLWGFEQLHDLNESKNSFKLRLKSLITSIKNVANDMYILGLQNGQVQVWSTYVKRLDSDANPYCPFKVGDKGEHVSAVSCLDVIVNNAATGSQDGTLKIWDMTAADLFCTHTYEYAHFDCINGVSGSAENGNIYASSGADGAVLLWDTRLARPASAQYEKHIVAFKSVVWDSQSNTSLFVGDELGFVRMIDVRTPNKFLKSQKLLERPIRKLFSKTDNLAIIGETNIVKIIKKSQIAAEKEVFQCYENNDSKGLVRDGIWHGDNEFLTVGFDGKLRHHKIGK